MLNRLAYLVISLMVTLSTLATNALAANRDTYQYQDTIVFHGSKISFGWFKSLDIDQTKAYYATMNLALFNAENGQRVDWTVGDASGYAVPVYTRPTGSGYCRRIHATVFAFGEQQVFSETACYENATEYWRWVKTR